MNWEGPLQFTGLNSWHGQITGTRSDGKRFYASITVSEEELKGLPPNKVVDILSHRLANAMLRMECFLKS